MREGYKSVLEFLEADLEIEEEQEHLYNQLATASRDVKVKETFQHLARAAKGHKDAIGKLIRDIESDVHDVSFYCFMCGWEINFGKMPSVGNEERCPLCCQKFALVDVDNDYEIKSLPQ
ncbi:MAG TPA: ferritin family protein [Candidatus Brocadiaceae bacterium]